MMLGKFGWHRVGYNFRPDWIPKSLRQPWIGKWWIWVGPYQIGYRKEW